MLRNLADTDIEARTSWGLCTHPVYRIQCDTAKLEKSERKQSKSLQNDQVDVEENQILERACQYICNACRVLEGISDLIEIPCGIGRCSKDSEDNEQVEESEKEVLGY